MAFPAARIRVEVRTLGSLAILRGVQSASISRLGEAGVKDQATYCLFVSLLAEYAPPLVLFEIQLPAFLREFMFADASGDVVRG